MAAITSSSTTNERWYKSKAFKRFVGSPLAIIGIVILCFFILISFFAPVITAPQIAERSRGHTCARDIDLSRGEEGIAQLRNPLTKQFWHIMFIPPQSCLRTPRVSFSPTPKPPSEDHIMGIASGGYDIFYGIIWGSRLAFYQGILVTGISLILGILMGGLAGYFGGWVDNLLMRIADTIYAFPNLIMAMVVVTVIGPSMINALLALSIVGWVGYARIIRGDILKIRSLEYVDSAKALGAKDTRVFFKHVFPNAASSLIILASLDIGTVVLIASGLAFLGLGGEVGTADWGQMVSFARGYITGTPTNPFAYWYVVVWPGLAIALFTLGWNLLGDAYSDAVDVRSN